MTMRKMLIRSTKINKTSVAYGRLSLNFDRHRNDHKISFVNRRLLSGWNIAHRYWLRLCQFEQLRNHTSKHKNDHPFESWEEKNRNCSGPQKAMNSGAESASKYHPIWLASLMTTWRSVIEWAGEESESANQGTRIKKNKQNQNTGKSCKINLINIPRGENWPNDFSVDGKKIEDIAMLLHVAIVPGNVWVVSF